MFTVSVPQEPLRPHVSTVMQASEPQTSSVGPCWPSAVSPRPSHRREQGRPLAGRSTAAWGAQPLWSSAELTCWSRRRGRRTWCGRLPVRCRVGAQGFLSSLRSNPTFWLLISYRKRCQRPEGRSPGLLCRERHRDPEPPLELVPGRVWRGLPPELDILCGLRKGRACHTHSLYLLLE